MQRKLIILTVLILPLMQVFSQNRQIEFIDPSINSSNEIITALSFPSLAGDSYNALIRGRADSLSAEVLTLYPERSYYFSGRDELLVTNHFGSYSYKDGIWQEESYGPSFSSGETLSPLPLNPSDPSPDGKYVVYISEDERGTASLILFDRDRKVKTTVTGSLKAEYMQDMVKWSPDSKYFIYRRGRELYYFSIDQYLSGRIPAESFRNTGFTDIQSVQWKKGNYLYILKGRYLYRVHSSEFFTRSFYSDSFRRGSIHGRLNLPYDPQFDSWALDEGGRNLVLVKDGRNAFVHSLLIDVSGVVQNPVLTAEYGSFIDQTEWLSDGSLLVRTRKIAGREGRVYRYSGTGQFSLLAEGAAGISVAPERDEFTLTGVKGADFYRVGGAEPFYSFDLEEVLDLHWGRDGYLISGRQTIRSLGEGAGNSPIIALSSIDRAGFSASGDIIAESGGAQFRYNEALQWVPVKGEVEIAPSRLGSTDYRIYLEDQRGVWFASSLKVRNLKSYYTGDLIPLYHSANEVVIPRQLRPVSSSNLWYFDHGTGTDRKEIALVFNAVDSADGTAELLDQLYRYRVPATFFLNGDFIGGNPLETRMIADSGHTVGSLFYSMVDLSSAQVDKNFLKKGLARNE
ncbi:MAG: polysaccharide deacetylase family protein, partial [Spirochaetales bacterium]|nr:polysaccharide deacetylase family protein [Spirochaetales bacterium]